MDPKTERIIIEQLQSGERSEEAFRRLMDGFQEPLYRCIRQWVDQHEDVNDILQNTFIKVFQNIDGFRGDAALFSWMYRIARNETYTYMKKKSRQPHSVEVEQYKDVRVTQQSLMEEEQLLEDLHRAVETLPDRQKQVFELRYFQAMKYSEMAELLDLTEGSLKASYHHAVQKVEDWIKDKSM